MNTEELLEFRRQKDEFFGKSPQSPLEVSDRQSFSGLRYYDPDPELSFTVFPLAGDESEMRVQTSDGQERVYHRAATVTLPNDGGQVSLTLYSTGHPGFFIPFRDSTSGKETYGAGRYLDIEPNEDGTLTVDFNLAYNPYCAYSDGYSCPLPPVENWLSVPIEAGELDYVK